ncbi:hypothetical protein AC579_6092 [Pseudocercospora musae]|uniref:Uncharacterized protein n=1 Tax=Pseudocercospora musae TaxID=113226 RepID=A0A139IAQ9_9PEZI|nr:hypothetical protein AC579_6092 [Pseudocercospora musae]
MPAASSLAANGTVDNVMAASSQARRASCPGSKSVRPYKVPYNQSEVTQRSFQEGLRSCQRHAPRTICESASRLVVWATLYLTDARSTHSLLQERAGQGSMDLPSTLKLDSKGRTCRKPITDANRALAESAPASGQPLAYTSTIDASPPDQPSFCPDHNAMLF